MKERHPIAECRERLGKISQEAFGNMLEVDAITVSRWERGESLPRRKYWPKLEQLTGQPIATIIAAARPVAKSAA